MNYPSAIVIAAGLIAGALLFNGQGISQTTNSGRYAIAATGRPDGAYVWRLDTTTGAVSICEGTPLPNQPALCGPWSRDAAAPVAPSGLKKQ